MLERLGNPAANPSVTGQRGLHATWLILFLLTNSVGEWDIIVTICSRAPASANSTLSGCIGLAQGLPVLWVAEQRQPALELLGTTCQACLSEVCTHLSAGFLVPASAQTLTSFPPLCISIVIVKVNDLADSV